MAVAVVGSPCEIFCVKPFMRGYPHKAIHELRESIEIEKGHPIQSNSIR